MNILANADKFFIMAASSVNEIVNGDPTGDVATSTQEVLNKVDNLGKGGIQIATRVGMFISVIVVIASGIGLMIANANKRDDVKAKLLYVLIGSGVVFAATGIVNLIQSVAGGIF